MRDQVKKSLKNPEKRIVSAVEKLDIVRLLWEDFLHCLLKWSFGTGITLFEIYIEKKYESLK